MTESGPRQQQRDAAEQVLADGLDVDLAAPPSRADLGLPDGQTSVVVQNSDRSAFEATVRFSDGHTLSTLAYAAGVRADSASTPPSQLTLRRTDLTLSELAELLRSATEDLGADLDAVEAFLRQADGSTERPGDLIRSITTEVSDPEELVLEPVVTAGEGRVSLNYLIRWETES